MSSEEKINTKLTQNSRVHPSLFDALLPVIILVGLLALSVYLYGSDSSYGANQIALLLAAGVAVLIGIKNGYAWKTIEHGIVQGISSALGAILILLSVGCLIGTWILAGTVPTLIYYGLQTLDPSIFYFASCLICAVVSISIGSSWTTAGTVGVALIGVSSGLGLSIELTAGAVISGAYFGDKMSPLSDTTNLAPAIAGTDLFTHIRHMMWTTVPAISLALILFLIIGFAQSHGSSPVEQTATLTTLKSEFNISIFTLIPMVVVFYLAIKKFPAFPTIMIGALVGGVFAFILQPDAIDKFMAQSTHGEILKRVDAIWRALFEGFKLASGNDAVDSLLSRGGMSSMLNTVWLILCALTFGAVLEHTQLLERLVISALKMVHSTGSLITTVILTCLGCNIIAADQYIAIVLPGRMYKAEFKRRNLDYKNLSRTLEDSATVTSAMIPWNTCGAFMAGTLGVATLAYLPFCFFNIFTPLISIAYGWLDFKIERVAPQAA